MLASPYRGRLAPSPTGYLHVGHARTFWLAYERARLNGGTLILRNEDLDPQRSRPEYVAAMIEDLRWLGLDWQEGPEVGGPHAPYTQSQRGEVYRAAFEQLRRTGHLYPCYCSRKEVMRAISAPHQGDEEPLYPGTCRPENHRSPPDRPPAWRFRVPEGETITFEDGYFGPQQWVTGRDLGDFVVWRPDGVPAYQLAVVADDAAMRITEVVRGADLLLSTARQILLYRALGLAAPAFYHCPLVTDEAGIRLAKRHEVLSLRTLRESGVLPADLRKKWAAIMDTACQAGCHPQSDGQPA